MSVLRLRIVTPSAIVVDDAAVASLRAEDESGAFGVLPGHADLLTALPASVLRWRGADGPWRFCVLSGGVLNVRDGARVDVAVRTAALGDDLPKLQAQVEALRAEEIDAARRAKVEETKLHARAVRQLMRLLGGDGEGVL